MNEMNKTPAFEDKILIFEPHPDDATFQLGGSVCKWIAEGKTVGLCTITPGNSSTFEMSVSSEEIARIMAKEHEAARRIMGLDEANFFQWGYRDLGIDPGIDRLKMLSDMVRLVRTFKPTTVVTMDPRNWPNEENPDHRLTAMTGYEAAALAANPNVLREQFDEPGVEQHYVARVLFYMSPEPDVYVDIAGEPFEKKCKLGLTYDSQLDLMVGEAKKRLANMGVSLPLFDLPYDILWPEICKQMAEAAATDCREKDPKRADIKMAEPFRLQYLGAIEKIREFLPPELNAL